MFSGYAKSGLGSAENFMNWDNVATAPCPSATHGGRFVNNYVNGVGAASYRKYEEAGPAKGWHCAGEGQLPGQCERTEWCGPPVSDAEKMEKGFNAATADWNYIIVMPNGAIGGATGGKNAANVQFCHDCHVAVADQDHMFFLPEEFRAK